jgi:hypothetical protein
MAMKRKSIYFFISLVLLSSIIGYVSFFSGILVTPRSPISFFHQKSGDESEKQVKSITPLLWQSLSKYLLPKN